MGRDWPVKPTIWELLGDGSKKSPSHLGERIPKDGATGDGFQLSSRSLRNLLLDFLGSILPAKANRGVQCPQQRRLVPPGRHLFHRFDLPIASQQRTIKIVHRRANVARKKVKYVAHLWTSAFPCDRQGQVLLTRRKRSEFWMSNNNTGGHSGIS